MLLMFIFTAITGTYCQANCPAFSSFSTYANQNGLQSYLNGTFLMTYTSAPVKNCQKGIYVIDANGVTTGRIESPGCCLKVDNFVFNSNQLDYDIGGEFGYDGSCRSTTPQNGSMKLLATTGSGSTLCIIVAICQVDYYGITVMCRGTPPLFTQIFVLLLNLLGLLQIDQILALQSVSQTNCVFPSNNCPNGM